MLATMKWTSNMPSPILYEAEGKKRRALYIQRQDSIEPIEIS